MLETAEMRAKVERAMLVAVETPGSTSGEAGDLLDELEELVTNLDIGVVARRLVKLREPNPALLLGKGKAAEIIHDVAELECDVIVFDNELTPAQQRNWEQESRVCVIDRQEVILDIFGERAQTREAVLQVELARLEYSLPRLRRAWTHLSRQRGGAATQRGEGEKQIQLDKRMVKGRIARLKQELQEVRQHREVQRKQRLSVPVPTAAIVGYTNAGKSSLLNVLTDSHLLAEDKLFATLDPTTRRTRMPSGQTLLLTDTVGFVRNLPHGLVDAFKATLEEALVSDFLVHVVDASSPDAEAHYKTTLKVLKELGADTKQILTVFNKSDLLGDSLTRPALSAEHPDALFVSAASGEGLPALRERMDRMLAGIVAPVELLVPHDRYDLVHRLHEAGAIRRELALAEGVYIDGAVPERLREPVRAYELNGASAAIRAQLAGLG